MTSILIEQGFSRQLDQYSIIGAIDEGCSNDVVIAKHKLNGMKVAIKAIPAKKYRRLQKENMVDEGGAMELCNFSEYVVRLVEKFSMDGMVYIVSKYAYGGDLLNYCIS